MSSFTPGSGRPDDGAAAQDRFKATRMPGLEYGTDRPIEVGRITYTEGVHRYVALAFHYTDDDSAWQLTWVGFDGTSDAVRLPEGIYPSAAMLAALAVAPVEVAA
jgi:hypothetical protein